MPLQNTNTVLYEVQQACKLLSLAPPTGVYDSQDETAILMGAIVNIAGTMINDAHNWQHLGNLFTVTGDGVENVFPLATASGAISHFIDNCGWDRTSRQKVYIVDAQQWNATKDMGLNPLYPCCRLIGDALYFLTPPSAGSIITFEYRISVWALDQDDQHYKSIADKNGDIPLFDWLLMVHAIRAKWLELKAMDNSGPLNDFQERFKQLVRNDVMANTLTLNGGWRNGFRYLDGVYNVSDTGLGS